MGRRTAAVLGLAAGLAMLVAGGSSSADDAQDASATETAAGKRAAASGDLPGARHHLLAALSLTPAGADPLGELLRLDAEDAELRRLWVLQGVLAAADAKGKFAVPKTWPKVPQDDVAFAQEIARLRAAALDATLGCAAKASGSAQIAPLRALEDLAYVLEDGWAAGAAAHDTSFAPARGKAVPEKKAVLGALLELAKRTVSTDPKTALAAARLVRGLTSQEPGSKAAPALPNDFARAAAALIDRLRAEQRKEEEPPPVKDGETPSAPARKVWTVEELGAIESEDVPAWNRAHADWSSPGVAESPGKLYRVETTCGLSTLLAVAEKVEAVHARLAKWIGSDPCRGRQGLIRVCPSDGDLECEGRPFWWAAGFQAADVTAIVARFPEAEGLLGTLAHELTHRFDHSAWSGLPVWALEGRATYAASCSPTADIPELDERYVQWGRLWEAQAKGYGTRREFDKLLLGTIDDYRQNYDAGYSLWLFLTRFRGLDAAQTGKPLYAPRIPAWLAAHRGETRSDPVKRFASVFADGKDGRAADLDALVGQFGKFAGEGGSGARPPAAWKAAWERIEEGAWMELAPGGGADGRIFDAPTWGTERARHDPPEQGEALARRAAELLLAAGMKGPAVEAMRWALYADVPDASLFVRAAEIEAAAGDAAAGWGARTVAHRISPWKHGPAEGVAPASVAPAVRAAAALIDAWTKETDRALAAGQRRVAHAARSERDRVAEACGAALLGDLPAPAAGTADAAAGEVREPVLIPGRSLLAAGVVEERWAPLDSQPGQEWRIAAADAIELGRKQPSADVSGALRDALTRKVSVRTREWLTGAYTVSTRVRFVSAFVDAALVVGRTAADRGVELRIGGGDWAYATGAREGNFELPEVYFRATDHHPWTERVSNVDGRAAFTSPREVFDVEIVVAGPFVRIRIDGVDRVSFRRATGAPVEGTVAFCLERGIVRFEEPQVRRHRVTGPERLSPAGALDEPLRLDRPFSFPWITAQGRRSEGVPADPRGTLLLWFPADDSGDDFAKETVERLTLGVRSGLLGPWSGFPRTAVVVPKDAVEGVGAAEALGCDAILGHSGSSDMGALVSRIEQGAETTELSRPYPARPVWIALDPEGVVRSCGPVAWSGDAIHLFRALAGR